MLADFDRRVEPENPKMRCETKDASDEAICHTTDALVLRMDLERDAVKLKVLNRGVGVGDPDGRNADTRRHTNMLNLGIDLICRCATLARYRRMVGIDCLQPLLQLLCPKFDLHRADHGHAEQVLGWDPEVGLAPVALASDRILHEELADYIGKPSTHLGR